MRLFVSCLVVVLFSVNAFADKKLPPEVRCLAENIYWEARNQSYLGMWYVGQVVMNRVDHDKFPDTICGVVYQAKRWQGRIIRNQCQFSWYCDGKSDVPREEKAWSQAIIIASIHIRFNAGDITNGALWYHANTVKPWWASSFRRLAVVDDHLFYGLAHE